MTARARGWVNPHPRRRAAPDAVIEAVGMEAHGADTLAQKVSSAVMAATVNMERPFALNQAIVACRPAGTVSMPGVYAGQVRPVALGVFMNKGLTLKTGQTHMLRYMKPLLERIEKDEAYPSFIIRHRTSSLEGGPKLYKAFCDKVDGCTKVVLKSPCGYEICKHMTDGCVRAVFAP